MKKLLVLAVFSAMAASASATPYVTVDGEDPGDEITIQPGDDIWIGLYLSIPTDGVQGLLVISEGMAYGEWTGDGHLYIPPDVFCIPELGPFCGYWDYEAEDQIWLYHNTDPFLDPFDGVVADAEFYCKSEGDVLIELFDVTFEVIDTLTIHQMVLPPGDFDEDGQVDCDDLRVLALAWMSKSGDDNWNPVCDISDPNDEVIDGRDFGVFAMDWEGCNPLP